jgi:hypothetical protein
VQSKPVVLLIGNGLGAANGFDFLRQHINEQGLI